MKANFVPALIGSLLLGASVTGCQRHSPASPTNAEANANNSSNFQGMAPAPPSPRGPGPMPPAGPVVVSNQDGENAALEQLSLELRKYVVRTRTVPKTYEEFIAKSNVQAPEPPAGKKYAIQNQAIVLVRR